MAKTLMLDFTTEGNKTSSLSIEYPKDSLDPAVVTAAMNQIIAANIIRTASGDLVGIKGARVVDRNVSTVLA
ncbi:DUF2922 domain-containing protein [Priestia koreensis]|uniref:DUF2922 domain-containing protein n=1 Tax=Priestia koreensis TaxID=284581 RepID=UPI0028F6C57C|nr:DUF2922 domain-containing protein [Priestia koreensis]